jgi:hypothetical protein
MTNLPVPSDITILQPLFVLVAWTSCILILLAFRRLKEKRLPESPPPGTSPASLANRNYMNLLESPVLFYVACLTAFVTGTATAGVITIAWIYVVLRIVHSVIHVTYNRVAHRFKVFAASIAVLLVLWAYLAVLVFKSP